MLDLAPTRATARRLGRGRSAMSTFVVTEIPVIPRQKFRANFDFLWRSRVSARLRRVRILPTRVGTVAVPWDRFMTSPSDRTAEVIPQPKRRKRSISMLDPDPDRRQSNQGKHKQVPIVETVRVNPCSEARDSSNPQRSKRRGMGSLAARTCVSLSIFFEKNLVHGGTRGMACMGATRAGTARLGPQWLATGATRKPASRPPGATLPSSWTRTWED